MNKNERHKDEYRLVTDGEKLYRLHPNFNVPDGIHEVFTHHGNKVYNSKGKLMPMFQNLQRIQPRANLKRTAIFVRNILGIK
jgi:hypothetical protein